MPDAQATEGQISHAPAASGIARLLLLLICMAVCLPAAAVQSNYCPGTKNIWPASINQTFLTQTVNPTGEPGGNITITGKCTTSNCSTTFCTTNTMTCGAYATCGGDKQLQCVGSPNYCTPGHAAFGGYAHTFDCDGYESTINNAISPLSISLAANKTVQSCLACGGNTSPLSCPGPVCDTGYSHHDTSGLSGSIGNCGYSGLTLSLIDTYGLCSPASPVDFTRPAHDAWPVSQTPSLERGTVFVLHGRGSSCGASMNDLLVAGGLLATNNLVYCVEYAQGDDGQPGAGDVRILRVPGGEVGANSACIATDTCSFDQASPVLVETAPDYSVTGVSAALYQALLQMPVVGEVTLLAHSQGGFIARDLLHRYYDDLRFRGRNVSRVITLAHPYFGREFDPHLYAPFQCIDRPDSFDCRTGSWLWGWQLHLATASPFTMDNTEFPQLEWSALVTQGSVEQPDGTGGVSLEAQPEACTSIFGGVLTSTVVGDNSVPVQSSLGIDEFGFFPGPDVLNFGLSVEAPIAISHNAKNLLAYLRSNYPQRLPVAYMNTTPAPFNALSFENAGAVALPDADVLNITGDLTLELWARPTRGGQSFTVLAGESGRYYLAMIGDTLYFALNDAATGWASVKTAFDLPVGQWSHIALTYAAAGGAEIYVNGHRQAFPAHSGAINTHDPAYLQFRLGNNEASGNLNAFAGQIDEVRVWSSHRSADQIRGGMKTVTPDASLQGWWRFEEQGGNLLLDASGKGHDIALDSVDPLLQPQRYANADLPGGARYFEGLDDTVAVLSDWPAFNMDQNLTIEAWIFPRGPGGTYGGVILNKEGEYALVRRPDGTIGWSLANANPGWASVATTVTAPQNTWTHIAMTYDGTDVKIYKNGSLASIQTYAGGGAIGDHHPAQVQLRIGGRELADYQQFHGVIDEVRLWNVTRSASDIAAGYLAGVSPGSTGLVGYWQFSENNKGVAFDSSTYVSATVGRHASLGAGGTDTATWPEQTVVSALPQALFLDTDGDGLADVYETHTGAYVDAGNTGTNPYDADSDGDGLADGAEVQTHNTDPTLADTDGDGFDDAAEIAAGTDPRDGLSWPVLSDGDLNDDGQLDIADLLVGYQVLFNQLPLTPLRLSHGDVAPLSGGIPDPDGMFTLGDVYVLQRMLMQ